MYTYEITLSDSEVEFLDDVSNDIRIKRKDIPFDDVSPEDSIVIVQYEEDPETVQHKYEIVDVNDEFVTLRWLDRLEESLLKEDVLNEANPFSKVKDFFKKKKQPEAQPEATPEPEKTEDEIFNDAAAKADAEQEQQNKKTTTLLGRDLAEGSSWTFYLQLPNEEFIEPLRYRDVADLYRKRLIGPWIKNAVVVDSTGNLVRYAGQDYYGQGVKFDSSVKPNHSFTVDWTNEDKKQLGDIVNALPEDSRLRNAFAKAIQEFRKNNADKEQQPAESEQTTAETKQDNRYDLGISSNSYKHFLKLIYIMRPKMYDAFDKPVDVSSIKELADKVKYNNLADFTIEIDGTKVPAIDWIKKAVKNKVLMEKILTEAPTIRLTPDEMNNPDEISIKKLIKNAEDKEEAERAAAEEAAKTAELKQKYEDIPDLLHASLGVDKPLDVLEKLFEKLVPSQGAADTVAGEYIRAIMRMLFRDYNDGDKFFEGYGLETCGSSAEYLFDNGFDSQIKEMMDDAYRLSDDDNAYTHALESLAEDILETIANDESLIYTRNEEDSRDYSSDYIQENQPRYEYELYGSDDIVTLVENGALSSWDLQNYVDEQLQWEHVYDGYELERPWGHHDTSVTVGNLTKDGLDYLSDVFSRHVDEFWQELVDEHADELNSDSDEDEDDVDYDDSYEEE